MPPSIRRVLVTGATGNLGTSVLATLQGDDRCDQIVGLARRPAGPAPKVQWVSADVAEDDLVHIFDGVDAVVHLAWALQPSHDHVELHRVNVLGSLRVFEAAAAAGVATLVYASSVGAYSPGPKVAVDESWPTHGVPQAWYARQKAYVERLLDVVEIRHPELRVVRLRPALVFKREAAAAIRRLFIGGLIPNPFLRPALIPVIPDIPGLVFQCVHSLDVGEAVRLALASEARGAFNLAADPVLDVAELSRTLGSRIVPVPRRLARAVAGVTWLARLQPTSPDWLDLALDTPLLDTSRARRELGWAPTRTAQATLRELLEGVADEAGAPTPHLEPGTVRAGLFGNGSGSSN